MTPPKRRRDRNPLAKSIIAVAGCPCPEEIDNLPGRAHRVSMAPYPPSPAAVIPNARTAGTSITVTSTSGRSRSASATRTIPTHESGLAASIPAAIPGSIGAGHHGPCPR
jgi:hypothetical protein